MLMKTYFYDFNKNLLQIVMGKARKGGLYWIMFSSCLKWTWLSRDLC